MNRKISISILIAGIIFFSSGCCSKKEKSDQNEPSRYLLTATLYNFYSAEYSALAYQAFNIAKERLSKIRLERPDDNNLAVVVDIDETILNNSPYEAKLMLDERTYTSESWYDWCNMGVAEAVPGALEFLQHADSLGFHVFYITNRKKESVKEGTIENVRKLGFPQAIDSHFFLRTDERNKEKRRQAVSENFEIVLLAGDNLGDFYENPDVFSERDKLMNANKDLFGLKFIVLPNAIYGDWLDVIGFPGDKKTVDSLLQIMAQPYANPVN